MCGIIIANQVIQNKLMKKNFDSEMCERKKKLQSKGRGKKLPIALSFRQNIKTVVISCYTANYMMHVH